MDIDQYEGIITDLEDSVKAHADHARAKEFGFVQAETRRAFAQGRADNYLLELQAVRKARERGRRANRLMRDRITELEARLYRFTNRS